MATNNVFSLKEASKPVDVSKSLLLAVPEEIILHMLRFLDTLSLLGVDCVCQRLRSLAQGLYRELYGPVPLHRKCDPIDFRTLVIEQLQLFSSERAKSSSPNEECLRLLDVEYSLTNNELSSTATDVLLILQRSPYRGTDAWNEAVATALMAQGRYAEAEEYYECIVKRGNSLPERTILTAARWGWPFTIPYPANPSRELLEEACIAAALSAASRMGHAHVLQLLHDNNINLRQGPQRCEDPLFEAAQHGHYAAARFLLLEAGARPDIPVVPVVRSPADIAAYMGEVDICHTPTMRTAHKSSGKLRIEPAIRGQRVNVINFLVKEACVDIKAADEKGQTALHLAVDSDNEKVVAAAIALGANVKAVDKCGQAAFERAVSRDCRITGWLAQRLGQSPVELKEQKVLSAKRILESHRSTHLQQIAAYHRESISSVSLEDKIETIRTRWLAEGMEFKLLEIWTRSMSYAALTWYITQMLGSAPEAVLRRISLLAWDVLKSPAKTWTDEKDEHELTVARNIAATILPDSSQFNRVAQAMEQGVPIASLRELQMRLDSPGGCMWLAGVKTKAHDEWRIIQNFVRPAGWSSIC